MEILIFLTSLLFSVILHEVMHGFVAERLGDSTARYAGRLTLNPVPHIDPIGTVLLPALMILPSLLSGAPLGPIFGWAKPVPVNPLNLREGRKDMALVALSGPLTNFALAIGATGLYHVTGSSLLIAPIILNLWLGILNLLPIPPLDGSKFISAFLPSHIAYQYESISKYGFLILMFLLFMPVTSDIVFTFMNGILSRALLILGLT